MRRLSKGFTLPDSALEEFGSAKDTAFSAAGFTTSEQDKIAQKMVDTLAPGDETDDIKRKMLKIVEHLPNSAARKVIARAQQLLNEKEASRGIVDRAISDPDGPTPLMSFLLRQSGMDKMTEDFLETAMAYSSDRQFPSSGWQDRIADEMVFRLLGKAKLDGRVATEDEIRDSMEAHNFMLSKLSENARAVHRMLVTTAAFQASQGKPIQADLARFIDVARWAEMAALKYWTDPAFKEKGGSASVHEARLTVVSRLMWEVAERSDLGPLEFNQAVHLIMIWWTADERLPNTMAEETVHGLLQAGAGHDPYQTSPWAEPTLRWLADWHQSAFARINVGHKLAAALALTDVPAEVPNSPWKAWSLVIPDGMFSDTQTTEGWDLVGHNHQTRHDAASLLDLANDPARDRWTGVILRRAWFHGTKLIAVLSDWLFEGEHVQGLECTALSVTEEDMKRALGADLLDMVRSLGLGVLAAITTTVPRKTGQWGLVRKRAGHKKPEKTPLGEIWDVSAPVTIDLREHVKSIQHGKGRARGPTTAAWVVRGHWRNQVHGPGRTLRKQIWIEPFWKGDESMRKLFRGVEVKE